MGRGEPDEVLVSEDEERLLRFLCLCLAFFLSLAALRRFSFLRLLFFTFLVLAIAPKKARRVKLSRVQSTSNSETGPRTGLGTHCFHSS